MAASAFGISGGVLNNIVMSRLYRAGSVAYVSTSGGMSNELNNTISRSSSGVFKGVAIGGKRELGKSLFLVDHMFRFHDALGAKILLFWARSGARMEPGEKVAKLLNPRWLWRFNCHAGAQVGGDLKNRCCQKTRTRRSLAFVPDVHEVTQPSFVEPFSDICRASQNFKHH